MSFFQANNPVCPFKKLAVVGGDNAGDAGRLEKTEGVNDFGGADSVQVGGGFVSQDDFGFVDDGACNGDALLFSAGKGLGKGVGAVKQIHFVQRCTGPGFCFCPCGAGNDQGQHDVVQKCSVGQEALLLENQPQVLAQGCDTGRFEVTDILAVDGQAAFIRFFDGSNHFEQGGFARAGGAGQKDHFSRLDGEGNVSDGGDITRIETGNVEKFNHGGYGGGLSQQGLCKFFGDKWLQVFDFFAYADKVNRDRTYFGNGGQDAAFCCAIQFGDYQSG